MEKKQIKKVIGIDIGGTKIKGALWDGKKVLKFIEFKTPKNLSGFVLILNKIVSILGKENLIAVGAAGIVEKKKIIKSPNISYIKNFNFSDVKELDFKIEKLDNDARCFAQAEYFLGGAKGAKKAFFVTLGTGVGRAVGEKGKVLKIKKFEYPEKWEKQYQKIRDSKNENKLVKFLGEKITELVKSYHPEVIVIGGGVIGVESIFNKIKKEIKIPVKKRMIKKGGTCVGAAIMILK